MFLFIALLGLLLQHDSDHYVLKQGWKVPFIFNAN
jgi:hypothetical protein